jgi:hypothetical protein
MRIASLVLIALLCTTAVSAQNQPNIDDYQVLLVPVFFFGPGAHGSQWETRDGNDAGAGAGGSS